LSDEKGGTPRKKPSPPNPDQDYARRYRVLRDLLGFTDESFAGFTDKLRDAKAQRQNRQSIAKPTQLRDRRAIDELAHRRS
jgi:hypothetical protein